jgi:hypothetical protein
MTFGLRQLSEFWVCIGVHRNQRRHVHNLSR